MNVNSLRNVLMRKSSSYNSRFCGVDLLRATNFFKLL